MQNASIIKIGLAIAGVAAVGVGAVFMSGVFNPQFADGGVDVRNTKCENIASARTAISTELENRKFSAQEAYTKEKDEISNAYWQQNQKLEAQYYECISAALTADPCKEPFERGEKLYQEIMAQFDAGNGFNEAKFNEREQAKKDYNNCVEQTKKPEFYKDKEAACNATLATGKEANQVDRTAKEATAKAHYDEIIATAEASFATKTAILDAIEKKCNEPGQTSHIDIGALNTGITGTSVYPNNSSCTGVFAGNDPNIQRQISRLEAQLQKAKAGGQTGGLYGSDHVQEALDRLHQELRDSERTCKVDADCGNPEPVCCSGMQVGQAYCNAGVCASKKTDCVNPEICAGKPAACVAPDTGLKQQNGVYITRTIPEAGACSQNLQTLNLQQSTPDSARYNIVGNIPNWLHIDKSSGSLPAVANVTYSCNTVQGFGPGVYTAAGSITVYNTANELINTIPFNVSITVTAVEKKIDVIEYNGKYLPTNQLIVESEKGCDGGMPHWHAAQGVVTATDGSKVPDPGPQCGYGKVKDKPVMQISAPTVHVEVKGLDSLKTQ